MNARCVVSDLDRTLTGLDLVPDEVALRRIDDLRAAGIRVVIATGRRLDELIALGIPPRVDALVAENGAIVSVEGTLHVRHPGFAAGARAAMGDMAGRFHWGQVVGSGPRALTEEATRRLAHAGVAHGFEHNAEEVMLLPPGVDKASGAELCLARLGIGAEETWAIGDGDNDASMLRWAGIGAAPANASVAARGAADVLLASSHAQAFVELTTPLLANRALTRHASSGGSSWQGSR